MTPVFVDTSVLIAAEDTGRRPCTPPAWPGWMPCGSTAAGAPATRRWSSSTTRSWPPPAHAARRCPRRHAPLPNLGPLENRCRHAGDGLGHRGAARAALWRLPGPGLRPAQRLPGHAECGPAHGAVYGGVQVLHPLRCTPKNLQKEAYDHRHHRRRPCYRFAAHPPRCAGHGGLPRAACRRAAQDGCHGKPLSPAASVASGAGPAAGGLGDQPLPRRAHWAAAAGAGAVCGFARRVPADAGQWVGRADQPGQPGLRPAGGPRCWHRCRALSCTP